MRTARIDPQGRIVEMAGGPYEPPVDEMDPAEREFITRTLAENRKTLEKLGKLSPIHEKGVTNFAWPLRQAAGRTDFDYHGISNFIDENAAYPNQLLDYMCGARTYDTATGYNHQGTDIFSWPFAWKKMDDEDVVIVAGAPGTILGKSDGNFDRSCQMNSNNWNAVYIQHADGSVAWYGHMKSGTTTVKAVGERVVAGEYLGTVGSSGSSTGPHLHLEIYDAANNLVDPWLGPCNAKSKQVTWGQQPAYRDTGVNAMTVGTAPVVFPACPGAETSNAVDFVAPGTTAYFTIYLRDQTTSTAATIRILQPDGSVYAGPISTGTGNYNASYWYWYYSNFPAVAGTWTFEATIAGRTYTKTFQVGGAPSFGTPASIAVFAGDNQSTSRGAAFASPLQVQVKDALARNVAGAKVAFTVPVSGATVVLESRTALTDASGIATVAAIANATAGSYTVTANVTGATSGASFSLQNLSTSPVNVSVVKSGTGSGTVTSSPAGITCGATCSGSFTGGATVTLTAVPASGSIFSGWTGGMCVGTSTCVVAANAPTSVTAIFSPATSVPRLGNISTRGRVLTGDNVTIGGFVIGGSAAKTVLVRARGPSMIPAGVADALADPQLTLVDQATNLVIGTNDNWGSASNASAISATGKAPANALEAAILMPLSPGAYTAIVSGVNNGVGVGIIEVFEIDGPQVPLVNISTRGRVLTGDNVMIGGFVIDGNGPQTVLIRARGPSMIPAGVVDALADPQMTLVSQATGAVLATNDNWGSAPNALAITATGKTPTNALESAILTTLDPGAYTVVVSGVNGGVGVGIVEVFAQ